jgi:hypothetical protein
VVEEAIASVEAAVERASREQRSGRMHVDSRLDELRLAERRLSDLHRRLADGASRRRSPVTIAETSFSAGHAG